MRVISAVAELLVSPAM